MSSKGLVSIVIGSVLLIAIVITAIALSNNPAPASLPANYYANSDWIERHPVPAPPASYYAGSDWIERHPVPAPLASYYAGSDWIERHPVPVPPVGYYVGSDWVERHSQDPYEAAEWARGAGKEVE